MTINRREFLRNVGIAGAAVTLGGSRLLGQSTQPASQPGPADPERPLQVPTRPFGKTGVEVSILSVGTTVMPNILLLRNALRHGVTYWDTATGYVGGNSERTIGKYFQANSDDRKKIFLVTKCPSTDPRRLEESLQTSFERMNTDYVDLFFLHAMSRPDFLNDDIKAWAERMKKSGKIKFIGFSTHKNMQPLLQTAAKVGWIDGIMTAYNYRLMHEDEMKRAVAACEKAGIGLTAMKTQAKRTSPGEGEAAAIEEKLLQRLIDSGYSQEQAKLKAVWEAPAFSAICSLMRNMGQLSANVAAATGRTKLALGEKVLLRRLADETCDGYCAGCGDRCEPLAGAPVADVMRSLMYYHNYGDPRMARESFAAVAPALAAGLSPAGLRAAEAACPNRLPIGELLGEAKRLLA